MKVLIVVAHADDEVLGMGGTICKHIENGDEIIVLVATEPNENYPIEYHVNLKKAQQEVDEFLGIKERYHLDYPCVSFNIYPYGQLNERFSKYIEAIKPEILYTHFKGDINQDHRIVYEACLVATRPPKQIKLVCFETISETEWGDLPFKPNYYVDISDYLVKKINAFDFYKTELKALPHPRNAQGIENLAFKRGLECGFVSAEAFQIVRWYE
ncbi:MAG: PIG-L deacetylase family protein [Candidatus Thorarchaeota archaeon]